MAIVHVGTSATPVSAAATPPTYPTGYTPTAGDEALLFVTSKPGVSPGVQPANLAGWDCVYSWFGGTGAAGATTGPVQLTIYSRPVVAGMTLPAIAVTGGTITIVTCVILREDTGAHIHYDVGFGQDTTSGTGYAATGDFVQPYTTGDRVFVLTGTTINASTHGTTTLTATGATFGTLTEIADLGATGSQQAHMGLHTAPVTAGPATAAPAFSSTMSAATTGGSLFLRAFAVADALTGGGTATTIAESSAATGITATLPAGAAAAGLYAVAYYAIGSPTTGFTGPAGWTQLIAPTQVTATCSFALYGRRLQAGDANPAASWTTSGRATAIVQAAANVDTTAPIDAAAAVGTVVSTATITAPAVTTTVADALILTGCVVAGNTTAALRPAAQAGVQQVANASPVTTGGGQEAALAAWHDDAAGSTGTFVWRSVTTTLSQQAWTIALRPAAGSTPISDADTSAAVETDTLGVSTSDADVSAGVDAADAPTASRSDADSVAALDAETVSAAFPAQADTSAADDAETPGYALIDVDAAATVEGQSAAVSTADADVAAAVETETVTTSLAGLDTAAGVEADAVTAALPDGDIATTQEQETLGVTTPKTDDDTSTAEFGWTVTAVTSDADTAGTVDTDAVTVTLSAQVDVAATVETDTAPAGGLLDADAATSADTDALAASASDADAVTALDDAIPAGTLPTQADLATSSETETVVAAGEILADADTAGTADTDAVTVTVTDGDVSASAEAVVEGGFGGAPFGQLPFGAGTGAILADADAAGTVDTDAVTALGELLADADTASTVEVAAVLASILDDDGALGVDTASVAAALLEAELITVLETGTGFNLTGAPKLPLRPVGNVTTPALVQAGAVTTEGIRGDETAIDEIIRGGSSRGGGGLRGSHPRREGPW